MRSQRPIFSWGRMPPHPPTLPHATACGYGLTIPYSSKPQFCHPLSQCLNETLTWTYRLYMGYGVWGMGMAVWTHGFLWYMYMYVIVGELCGVCVCVHMFPFPFPLSFSLPSHTTSSINPLLFLSPPPPSPSPFHFTEPNRRSGWWCSCD